MITLGGILGTRLGTGRYSRLGIGSPGSRGTSLCADAVPGINIVRIAAANPMTDSILVLIFIFTRPLT